MLIPKVVLSRRAGRVSLTNTVRYLEPSVLAAYQDDVAGADRFEGLTAESQDIILRAELELSSAPVAKLL